MNFVNAELRKTCTTMHQGEFWEKRARFWAKLMIAWRYEYIPAGTLCYMPLRAVLHVTLALVPCRFS